MKRLATLPFCFVVTACVGGTADGVGVTGTADPPAERYRGGEGQFDAGAPLPMSPGDETSEPDCSGACPVTGIRAQMPNASGPSPKGDATMESTPEPAAPEPVVTPVASDESERPDSGAATEVQVGSRCQEYAVDTLLGVKSSPDCARCVAEQGCSSWDGLSDGECSSSLRCERQFCSCSGNDCAETYCDCVASCIRSDLTSECGPRWETVFACEISRCSDVCG